MALVSVIVTIEAATIPHAYIPTQPLHTIYSKPRTRSSFVKIAFLLFVFVRAPQLFFFWLRTWHEHCFSSATSIAPTQYSQLPHCLLALNHG